MATSYKTPGVYIEEIPKLPPSVAQVETAIPVFIGYTAARGTATAPLPTTTISGVSVTNALRITSMIEYETLFGSAPVTVTLSTTGADATLARTATATLSPHRLYYHMQLYFANGGGPCYIISVGDGNTTTRELGAFQAGLTMAAGYDEPTLIVIPEASELGSQGDRNTLYTAALTQAALLQDRFVIMDVADAEVDNFRNGIGTNNLKYGAAYHPFLKTNLASGFSLSNTTIAYNKSINDADFDDAGEKSTRLFSALTVDEQAVVKAQWDALSIVLPPSAAVAGAYAQVDSTRGVWKAPANVSLNGVLEPTKRINDEDQKTLNVHDTGKSINAIRAFTGKGVLIWGARTLAGNDNEWRYVPVRRFFNMVEESSKKATEPFVFEPNDANTWVKVQGMLENFLTTLWRQGALQGAKPEHAFYVAVGLNKTMTALDILEGRMIVEIGMAVVRPAEFIILRFSHKMAES